MWFDELLKSWKKNKGRTINLPEKNVSMFPESVDTNSSNKAISTIGENENIEHYSGVLLQTDTFVDYAKSSTNYGGVKKWFEKIILGKMNYILINSVNQSI